MRISAESLKKSHDKNNKSLFGISIMNPDYHSMAMELLNSGIGDEGRLKFILECISNNKPLYNTDIRFLENNTYSHFAQDLVKNLIHTQSDIQFNLYTHLNSDISHLLSYRT